MGNGILLKATAAANPAAGVTLQKLRKDAQITAYDVFAFDALHSTSWPSQANPEGTDKLRDLSGTISAEPDDLNNAATFAGSALVTFNGGFQFEEDSNSRILLPASCKPAPTSKGFIAMCWMLVPETVNVRKLFGWGTAGSFAYSVYASGNNRQFVIYADGSPSLASVTLTAGDFAHAIGGKNFALALFCVGRAEDGAGGFLKRARVYTKANGLRNSYSAAGPATAAQSTEANAGIGYTAGFDPNLPMRVFRRRQIDVKTSAGVMTSAQFDAWCDAEFNANKARDDWVLA